MAEISAFCVKSANLLLAPSVSRMPFAGHWNLRREHQRVSLKFVSISDDFASSGKSAAENVRIQTCDSLKQAAAESLMKNVSCDKETLVLETKSNHFAAAALEKSRKFYSSHLSASHPYLDSKELHYWLKRFLPHVDYMILRDNTLPVIVIHTHEFVLLDRSHQAVAFDDMVIAVMK